MSINNIMTVYALFILLCCDATEIIAQQNTLSLLSTLSSMYGVIYARAVRLHIVGVLLRLW